MSVRHQYAFLRLSLLMASVLMACVRPLEFDQEAAEQRIQIYGRITTHPGPYDIVINRTQTFGDVRPAGVEGVIAFLVEDGIRQEQFQEGKNGHYRTSGEIIGRPGREYWIDIRLPDGRHILSRPEMMPEMISIDSMQWELRDKILPRSAGLAQFQKFIDVFLHTSIPEQAEGPYLRWEAEDAWSFTEKDSIDWPFDIPETCYLLGQKPNPQAIMLFDGDRHNSGPWRDQFLASRRVDSSFTERHIFLGFQSVLTRSAFEYWQRLDQVVNLQGTIFDAPPAPIGGNLYDADRPNTQILGFFEANAVDTAFSRIVATDFATEYVVEVYCFRFPWDVKAIYPSHCYNCEKIPGMIKERPYYWD
ncbi:MAG: DUF4249 family protein [Bacteroidota bacterium]